MNILLKNKSSIIQVLLGAFILSTAGVSQVAHAREENVFKHYYNQLKHEIERGIDQLTGDSSEKKDDQKQNIDSRWKKVLRSVKEHLDWVIGGIGGIIGASILYTLMKNKAEKPADNSASIYPIIFHKKYDIGLLGLERLHPFDTAKYGKAFNYITSTLGIAKNTCYTPDKVTDTQLLAVHTQRYLDSLKDSSTIAQVAEVGPLALVPNALLQKQLLEPMRYATGGTLLGVDLALQHGWAINLSGGYHHAKRDSGSGFCFYADIPLAVHKLRQTQPNAQVLVIDLDAHQGNGHEAALMDDQNTHILDVYNGEIYPHDEAAKRKIRFNHPVRSGIGDQEYLALLERELPRAMDAVHPDFIIYNAGTDILAGDRLGRMNVSEDGITRRDALVFRLARDRNIPTLMVLSGGYTQESAHVIGVSVVNVLRNIIKLNS